MAAPERGAQWLRQHWPVGRNLKELRDKQAQYGICERYDVGHWERLCLYEPRTVWRKENKVYCTAVHGDGCQTCTTCHFCRQKVIGQKTFCRRCGDASGIWCGNCLDIRMGENLKEVLPLCASGDWLCPVCRGLCNCSGAGCIRLSRGWEKTGQLHHEVRHLQNACPAYKSVAHYLVLTAIDCDAPRTAGAVRLGGGRRFYSAHPRTVQQRQPAAVEPSRQGAARLKRAQEDLERSMQASKEAFEQLQRELQQQVALQCNMGLDVLDAGHEDEEEQQQAQQPQPRAQQQYRNIQEHVAALTSSHGGASGRLPVPLFSGAGGAAAAAAGGRVSGAGKPPLQQQQQGRGSNGASAPGAAGRAAAGAGGGSGPAATGGAGAAAGLDQPSPSAGADPFEVLSLFNLRPEDLGVLAIRGCSPTLLQQQQQQSQSAQGAAANPQQGSSGCSVGAAAQQQQQQQHSRPLSAGPADTSHQQQRPQQQQWQPLSGQQQQQRQTQVPGGRPSCSGQALPDFGPHDLLGPSAPGVRGSGGEQYTRQQRQRRGTTKYAAAPHRGRSTAGTRPWSAGQFAGSTRANTAAAAPAAAGGAGAGQTHRHEFTAAAHTAGGSAAAAGTSSRGLHAATASRPGARGVAFDNDVISLLDDDDVVFGTTSAPGSRAAGMQGPADADQPPAKRARLSGGHSNRSTAQQRDNAQAGTASGSAGSRPRYVVPAYSSLVQAEGLQLDLQEELGVAAEVAHHPVGPEGVPLDELCELLQGVVEAAVEVFDQGALSAGTVKQDGTPTSNTCSMDTLQRVCKLLVWVAELSPPQPGMDPSHEDIVRRLSNQEWFVDFGHSGTDARGQLIRTAQQLLEVFHERQQVWPATQEAWVATGCKPAAPAGLGPVLQLAKGALDGMELAREGIMGVVDCLLDWMAQLHKEMGRVWQLQKAPREDLLRPLTLGHIHWGSADRMRRQDWLGMSPEQVQVEEESLLKAREMDLDVLAQDNSRLLGDIAKVFTQSQCLMQSQSQCLARELAVRVLQAEVTQQLLDLDALYPAQVRSTVLLMVRQLLTHAAPDLQDNTPWQVGVGTMQQRLQQLTQQPPQQLQSQLPYGRPPDNSTQLMDAVEELLHMLRDQHLEPAVRQQQLFELFSTAGPQLLKAVEGLVDAEYQYRNPPDPITKQTPRKDTSEHLLHSRNVGSSKIAVLGALYALQLQSGSCSWSDPACGIERRLAQPAADLTAFFRGYRNKLPHRRFVLYLASQVVSAAPSLLRWDLPAAGVHQQRPQQAAAGTPSPGIPAVTLLQLWLRSLLDQHPPEACAKSIKHASDVLRSAPATAPLFAGFNPVLWEAGNLQGMLQRDCGYAEAGADRAQLMTQVLTAVKDSQGVAALGMVLHKLHLDLDDSWVGVKDADRDKPKTSIQFSSLRSTVLLRWQRSCLLSVLKVVDYILQYPALNTHVPVKELMNIASRWMQDGIKAVCGLRRNNRDCSSPTGSNCSAGEGAISVEATALQHLPNFLGLVVRVAAQTGGIEGTSTTSWPARPISSGASSQPLHMTLGSTSPMPQAVQMQLKGWCCLRDLLGTALRYLPAEGQSDGQGSALLSYLSWALVKQSGLLSSQQQELQPGYTSPGLLHHTLNLHVQAVLKGSVSGAPVLVHMAVNALLLTRCVFQYLMQPGGPGEPSVMLQCSQQLLLPCLAYPLLDVLAGEPRGCARVQRQAYQLLQQLLCGPVGRQLLPAERPQKLAGALMFGSGPLACMKAVAPSELQGICYQLMRLSLHTCLAAAATAAAAAAGADAQPAQNARREAEGDCRALLGHILKSPGVFDKAAKEYPEPETHSARLLAPSPTVGPQEQQQVEAVTSGLGYILQLLQQPGVAQQAATDILPLLLPALHVLLCRQPQRWSPAKQGFLQLVAQLPQAEQPRWAVVEVADVPKPPTGMQPPPHPYRPGQQQQQYRQPGQQQRQQQPPRQQGNAGRAAAVPAAPSQAHSAFVAPHAQHRPAAGVAGGAEGHKHVTPAQSVLFSQGGGHVASCCGPMDNGHGTSAAARAARKRCGSQASAGQQREGGEDEEDGDCGTSSVSAAASQQHKKLRTSGAAAAGPPGQQRQQSVEGPDVMSQDQGPSQAPAQQLQQKAWTQMQATQPQQDQTQGVLSPQLGQQMQQTQQLTRRQSSGSLGPTSSGNVRVPTSKGYLLSWPRQEGSVSSGSASGEVPKPAVLKLSTTLQAHKGTVSQIKLSGHMLERCWLLDSKGLLKKGGRVMLRDVGVQVGRNELLQKEGTELLVDPTEAAAAGVMVSQQQRRVWNGMWNKQQQSQQQTQQQQPTQQQQSQQQHPTQQQKSQQQHPIQQQQPQSTQRQAQPPSGADLQAGPTQDSQATIKYMTQPSTLHPGA